MHSAAWAGGAGVQDGALSWGAIVLPTCRSLPCVYFGEMFHMLHFPKAGQKECLGECSYLIEPVQMFVRCCVTAVRTSSLGYYSIKCC